MAKTKRYFPVILGTGRKNRRSEPVANFVVQQIRKAGHRSTLIDVRDYPMTSTIRLSDQKTKSAKKYQGIVKRADGLVIVAPEYNHGYPGELKLLLDTLYKEYWGKPMGIIGVSNGAFGGARVVEQLRQVAVALHMTPVGFAVYFGDVNDAIVDEKIAGDKNGDRIAGLIKEMVSRKG